MVLLNLVGSLLDTNLWHSRKRFRGIHSIHIRMRWLDCFILIAFLSACDVQSINCNKQSLKMSEYLDSQLSSYDLIDLKHIITKRSLGLEKEVVVLTVFNRTFDLILTPVQPQSVSNNFGVSFVDPVSGKFTTANASSLLSDFYSGHIDGEPGSKVTGYYTNGQLVCTIFFCGNILTIEPVSALTGNVTDWRLLAYYNYHLRYSHAGNGSSDSGWCGLQDSVTHLPPDPNQQPRHSHQKRSSLAASPPVGNLTVCTLQMVADHMYFKRIGMGQLGATVRSIVKIVDDVNEIYRATVLVDPTSGDRLPVVEFELASILVMSVANSTPEHFNAPFEESVVHKASNVLEAFCDFEQSGINFAAYCVNHLVTFKRMDRNVLGLAYFDSLCSKSYVLRRDRKKIIAQNSGFTTFSNVQGYPLLRRRAVLVTAHELGHNLGSKHDPVGNAACFPKAKDGGPYIMHERAVTGRGLNNNKFSSCSIQQFSNTVKVILGDDCLKAPNPRLCGNHRIEPGEACDSGAAGDACCTGQCQLRPGAVCSDAQQGCCLACKVAHKGSVCLATSPLRPCKAPASCNGTSPVCPSHPSQPEPDGTLCNSGVGRCLAGVCESACHPGRHCSCPDSPCQLCCTTGDGSACVRFLRDGAPVPMPVETPCSSGGDRRCDEKGACVLASYFSLNSGRPVVRMLDSSSFASKNMVFIVLAVTLLLYVPACLIWHYRTQLATSGVYADVLFSVST